MIYVFIKHNTDGIRMENKEILLYELLQWLFANGFHQYKTDFMHWLKQADDLKGLVSKCGELHGTYKARCKQCKVPPKWCQYSVDHKMDACVEYIRSLVVQLDKEYLVRWLTRISYVDGFPIDKQYAKLSFMANCLEWALETQHKAKSDRKEK